MIISGYLNMDTTMSKGKRDMPGMQRQWTFKNGNEYDRAVF